MGADRFRRIVDLQKQLQRSAEWRLHELRQQEQSLRLAQQEALGALDRDDPLCNWMAPTLSRRLARLAAEAETTAAAGDRQADLVLEQTRRSEQADRRKRATEIAQRRADEKAALGDVIDLIVGGSRARVR